MVLLFPVFLLFFKNPQVFQMRKKTPNSNAWGHYGQYLKGAQVTVTEKTHIIGQITKLR